jgi:multiple antibiotic resistance protein
MHFDFNIFFLSFIPLFVAIDVLGVVPLFVSLTDAMTQKEKGKLITEATFTAMAVSVVFLFGGKMIFNYLGITGDDFRVGGGIVLLVLAVNDLLFASDDRRRPQTSIGVVPLGIPLIIGPAALTTLLIIVDNHGYFAAVVSLFVNLFLVWLVFRNSSYLTRLMGEAGLKAFSKVASLFMAAIAIMMIRVGLSAMIWSK